MKLQLAFLLIAALVAVSLSETPKPLVNLPSGKVRGHFKVSTSGRNYGAFEGIPYARPPVGKYRFREPQPVKPWRGIWEANYLHTCLQYDHYTDASEDRVIGSEDCLYLNVYTAQLNQAAMLDVIVYVHGGAFMFGGSRLYGEKILMNRDVVYVNLNYRLGPLGFLSTEDATVPGNNGLRDQVLALKWIKENIMYFGGNPDSVTLTGMSAGGASVHLHYMSPLSTGLFNRGFSLSGTALNPWVLTENSLDKAKKLASSVGCDAVSSREMVDCMRFRPGRQLVQNVAQFFGFLYNPFSPFGVVVEPPASLQPFLSEHPYDILKAGKIQNLTWITSVTQAEGLYTAAEFVSDPNYLKELDLHWDTIAPHILDYNYTANTADHKTIAAAAKAQYLRGKSISKGSFHEVVQMMGDRLFVVDSQDAAKLHAQASPSPVYYYYFSYRGAHSKSETLSRSQENLGAAHGDDVVYVLSTTVDVSTTVSDQQMTDLLVDFWISYAKTGLPNVGNVTWPTVTATELPYIQISSPLDIMVHPANTLGNAAFWQSLPINENKNILPLKDEL